RERQRTALFLRHDPFQRFISALVFIQRDKYDSPLRILIQSILERELGGTCSAFYTTIDDSAHARLRFIIDTTPGNLPDFDLSDIQNALTEASRSWSDSLLITLIDAHGEEDGIGLYRRYSGAFPVNFSDRFSTGAALYDIDRIEWALKHDRIGLNLYRPLEARENELRFKIYNAGGPIPLSDVLPMLEHMGLRVLAEMPFEIRPRLAGAPVWIHDFMIETGSGLSIDLTEIKEKFQVCFDKVWQGTVDDDNLNKLVLAAGLSWREIQVLRAFSRFMRQARLPFSLSLIEDTLATNPAIARALVKLFLTRFDPALDPVDAERNVCGLAVEIDHALEAVDNLDEDLIIRRFIDLMDACQRTNFFQSTTDGSPKPHLSLKFDSHAIPDLPEPKPAHEIFVYSPRVEAVHLRSGHIARGGIRWSDRREDFRTEILGLMKAQVVKNTVIVPVGAKGGFVVKKPPKDGSREEIRADAIDCYKMMIRGLLDITDNVVDGQTIHPQDVVCRDGDDPYLVVAADKGTATFSDTANSISAEYGFWLGDAFASGGSAGYDHKKMGITARGGWECVKRHFREMGDDVQNKDFTVVGVGDMSGDVFGNAMLLSPHIRLIGAFNHMDIFVDPDPDRDAPFAERARLFARGR
ncbi:MAG: NAD-glutamate dehydrogenase, partial [Pseudomonadota bacterium]|nr:NAD-glutamate dehydrogenase [Pseudomonadota bacterium]